ncbi:MAG TPA: hypothetical protein VGI33_18990 [Paenibacillus sp.]
MLKCTNPCESRGTTNEAAVMAAEEQPQVFLDKKQFFQKVNCTDQVETWEITVRR